jgi:thiol-disulfide isomerase/thioredoxin
VPPWDERKKAQGKKPQPEPFARRYLKFVEAHPNTEVDLIALWWAVTLSPNTEPGQKAMRILSKEGRIARADLEELSRALNLVRSGAGEKPRDLAPVVLARVKRQLDHPKAARLLTWVCTCFFGDQGATTPPAFAEAAELLVPRFAGSPDIANFCEVLAYTNGTPPPWARKYEKHLRMIREKNRHRLVRAAALIALALIVQDTGEARVAEAEELFEQFLKEFDGKDPKTRGVEEVWIQRARWELEEIRSRGVGKPAPEIDGVDLDGRPMKLSEYRGRVVLLSFWATWCFPCMKLLPHERALVERLKDKPFALVGVNADTEQKALDEAVKTHKISWRSFRDRRADKTTTSDAWKVLGFPTLYLIDHRGIVRKRWIGSPPPEELNREIDRLVEEAVRSKK